MLDFFEHSNLMLENLMLDVLIFRNLGKARSFPREDLCLQTSSTPLNDSQGRNRFAVRA